MDLNGGKRATPFTTERLHDPTPLPDFTNARVEYVTAGGSRNDWPVFGHFGVLPPGESSAGGIGFKSRQKLAVGDQLEIDLSIPPALPGGNFHDCPLRR